MARLVAMLARAVLEDSAARQARWAQMQRPFLVGMAEPEEMRGMQARVLREWLE